MATNKFAFVVFVYATITVIPVCTDTRLISFSNEDYSGDNNTNVSEENTTDSLPPTTKLEEPQTPTPGQISSTTTTTTVTLEPVPLDESISKREVSHKINTDPLKSKIVANVSVPNDPKLKITQGHQTPRKNPLTPISETKQKRETDKSGDLTLESVSITTHRAPSPGTFKNIPTPDQKINTDNKQDKTSNNNLANKQRSGHQSSKPETEGNNREPRVEENEINKNDDKLQEDFVESEKHQTNKEQKNLLNSPTNSEKPGSTPNGSTRRKTSSKTPGRQKEDDKPVSKGHEIHNDDDQLRDRGTPVYKTSSKTAGRQEKEDDKPVSKGHEIHNNDDQLRDRGTPVYKTSSKTAGRQEKEDDKPVSKGHEIHNDDDQLRDRGTPVYKTSSKTAGRQSMRSQGRQAKENPCDSMDLEPDSNVEEGDGETPRSQEIEGKRPEIQGQESKILPQVENANGTTVSTGKTNKPTDKPGAATNKPADKPGATTNRIVVSLNQTLNTLKPLNNSSHGNSTVTPPTDAKGKKWKKVLDFFGRVTCVFTVIGGAFYLFYSVM